MTEERPKKIMVVADELGVTHKTIYNWLENGYLKLYHPGYILPSEARRAQIRVANAKATESLSRSKVQKRDRFGRFLPKD